LLKDNSYKTSAVSAEYRFSNSGDREISVGALFIKDKAGSLDFRNGSINFSTSVVQNLGNPDKALHSIAIGFNVGWANIKLDYENAQWPGPPPTDINDKTSYPDVAAGLLWQYKSKAHFSFQLGSALHHFNSPNVSLSDSSVSKLNHRLNLHGNVEIPLFRSFSMVPSFLFSSQGPSEQLTFGFNNRWYPKSSSQNFVQLGIFAKTTKNYSGTTDVNIYVLSATVEINSFLVGFSFDRFQNVESNAYEFSIGYTFGKHDSKGKAGNIGYSQAGIVE
jgi:type IX secretion system PorP/SprF family membrane protein